MRQKTFVVIFCSIAFAISANAQTSPFKFGVFLYPNFSNNILIVADGHEDAAQFWDDLEIAKPSFSANIFVAYNLTPKLSVSLGLGYANVGERTKKFATGSLTFPEAIDPFYGFVKPSGNLPSTETRFVYNHHFVEIPVQIKYSIAKNFYVQSGPSLMVALAHTSTQWKKTDGEIATRTTREDTQTDFRSSNFALNFGLGRSFSYRNSFEWFVGVNGQYLFQGISSNAKINRKYYSVGLVTGILF